MELFISFVNLLIHGVSWDSNPYHNSWRYICWKLFVKTTELFEKVIDREYIDLRWPPNTYPALYMEDRIDWEEARDASYLFLRSPGSYIAHKIYELCHFHIKNDWDGDSVAYEWLALLQANGFRIISTPQIEKLVAELQQQRFTVTTAKPKGYVGILPQVCQGGAIVWWDGHSLEDGCLVCSCYSWDEQYRIVWTTPDYRPSTWIEIDPDRRAIPLDP